LKGGTGIVQKYFLTTRKILMNRFSTNQRSTTDEAIVTRQSEVQLATISLLASNQGNYSSTDFGSSIQELEGFKKTNISREKSK
jgi:hypothetical protein